MPYPDDFDARAFERIYGDERLSAHDDALAYIAREPAYQMMQAAMETMAEIGGAAGRREAASKLCAIAEGRSYCDNRDAVELWAAAMLDAMPDPAEVRLQVATELRAR